MITKDDVKDLLASKGIRITKKGYVLEGKWYPIADWPRMFLRIRDYDPLAVQVLRWMKAA